MDIREDRGPKALTVAHVRIVVIDQLEPSAPKGHRAQNEAKDHLVPSVQKDLLDQKVRLESMVMIGLTERKDLRERIDQDHLVENDLAAIKLPIVARTQRLIPSQRSLQDLVQAFKTTKVLDLLMTLRCTTTSIRWIFAAKTQRNP